MIIQVYDGLAPGPTSAIHIRRGGVWTLAAIIRHSMTHCKDVLSTFECNPGGRPILMEPSASLDAMNSAVNDGL